MRARFITIPPEALRTLPPHHLRTPTYRPMTAPRDRSETFGEIRCRCGYDRAGSGRDHPCPECGEVEIWQGGSFAQLRWAWRTSGSRVAKAGLIFALFSLLLGLTNSTLTIYVVAWLMTPGFKGGMAGMALLYPPLIWAFLQLPATLLALVPLTVCGPSTEAVGIIRRLGFCLSGIGFVVPVVIFAVAIGALIASD